MDQQKKTHQSNLNDLKSKLVLHEKALKDNPSGYDESRTKAASAGKKMQP